MAVLADDQKQDPAEENKHEDSVEEPVDLSSGSGNIIDDDRNEAPASKKPALQTQTNSLSNQGQTSGRSGEAYLDLPYLLGGEPKNWFRAKIADIEFLHDDYVRPQNINEHEDYTKVSYKDLGL